MEQNLVSISRDYIEEQVIAIVMPLLKKVVETFEQFHHYMKCFLGLISHNN
jgi:hypothetical protein